MIKCRLCGAENLPNTVYCEECGASLGGSPPADPRAEDTAEPATIRLIIKASGYTYRMRYGEEILVGRKDPQSNLLPGVDLTDQGGAEQGVSRRHAKISFPNGQPHIEDTGSTNGTWLGHRQLEPFLPYPLESGSEVSLGNLVLLVDFA